MTDLAFPKVPKRKYPETEDRKPLSPKQRIAVIEGQKKRCKICGCSPRVFELDHIQELQEGGSNDPSNWQALCRDCHSTKTRGSAARRKKRRKLKDKTSQWAKRKRKAPEYKQNRNGSITVKEPTT